MDNTLSKLNEAINHCDETEILDVNLPLTYAELNYIRRLIMTDNYANELAVDNLRRASRKGKSKDSSDSTYEEYFEL